jgi:hypothetical protein
LSPQEIRLKLLLARLLTGQDSELGKQPLVPGARLFPAGKSPEATKYR